MARASAIDSPSAKAGRALRQILVDHARHHTANKRGGDLKRVTLDERLGIAAGNEIEVLDLDLMLEKLAEMDRRMARIVELRVFAGLTAEEVARLLGGLARESSRRLAGGQDVDGARAVRRGEQVNGGRPSSRGVGRSRVPGDGYPDCGRSWTFSVPGTPVSPG
jgi:hypothetical protein